MKLRHTIFLIFFIMAFINFASAQRSSSITGKISNLNGQTLENATIYLFTAKDSTLVKTALTDTGGIFKFDGLKPNAYTVTITIIGYRPYKSEIILLKDTLTLPAIILQRTEAALKEVTISGQKPFVEHKIDRTVINVDALISNAGSTVFDVLEKSPGVSIDKDGVVGLKGKAVTIFIDDKLTYLSGPDLANYLRSLSSSTVEQIELMPNPPAKYDASGNGGINIRTKKSTAKGFNGSINLSYLQGRYAKTNNNLNFNYRSNKFNLFGNIGYNTINNFSDLDINRHFEDANGQIFSNFLQNSFSRNTGKNYNVKIALDYYVSGKTTIGASLVGRYRPTAQKAAVSSKFSNAQNSLDSLVNANNSENDVFKNGALNFNYRHQFDKRGREITADFDYLNYQDKKVQSFNNDSYLANSTLVNTDLLTGTLPTNINIYSAKADYDHPLKKGFKLAVGVKSSYTQTDNIADYFYTISNITAPDYTKTNHFLYKENINAIYINANKDLKNLSVQAGLRLENTVSDGHQLGNLQKPDSTFKKNYTSLFPTIYFQYKLDSVGNQQLELNYGRRIDRPYYQDLNPFLSPLDKFTYYTGNPFLKPSYTDAIELSHTYKNQFTTTLSYSRTYDQVNETIQILNGIYYSKPGNIGSSTVKSISVDANFDLANWLNFHLYGQLSNIHDISAFYTGLLNTQGTFFYIKPILQFKFDHDWIAQLDGTYQSKETNSQFIAGPQKRVNAAISKKLSTSTTIKIVLNDIFYSYVNSGMINNLSQTKADYRGITDTRTGVISFIYRFGKAISNQRKHEANGAEPEKDRVKN